MEKNVRSNPFGQKKADSGSNPYNETTTNQTKPPTKKPIENKEHREQHTHTSSNVNKMPDTDSGSLESFRKEYESLKQFNCSKNFLRATCEKFPANSNLIKEASFPLGLVINPCSTLEPDLPTVNYGESEIPRCNSSQCRAYLNPFVKWVDGGDKWICNLCKNVNTTESYYYGKLDKSGMRSDYREKADLCNGSYEFIANKTYMKKDKALSSPTYIFLIDVSQMSSQNGFLSAVIESIKSAINDDLFPYNERTKIGFITYDNSVQFYLMNPGSTQPQMLCVSDENIFLPSTLDSLIVSLDSSKEILINTLDSIASSFVSSSCKDSQKIFTAINAGYLLAKSTGGKLLVFNASQSMTILNKMKTPNVVNIPKDEAIYSPTDDKQLSTMGINMTNENISLDLFIACESYVVSNLVI
jgi:protein transport protein SEC24